MPKDKKITAIVDTREQLPLDLEAHGLEVVREKLDFGDYSVKYPNLKNLMAIERKSLDDFVACCGRERARFEREIKALQGFRYAFIVCEFSYSDLYHGRFRSQIKALSVTRSVARWTACKIPFIMAENREYAARAVADFIHVISKDVVDFAKHCVDFGD